MSIPVIPTATYEQDRLFYDRNLNEKRKQLKASQKLRDYDSKDGRDVNKKDEYNKMINSEELGQKSEAISDTERLNSQREHQGQKHEKKKSSVAEDTNNQR